MSSARPIPPLLGDSARQLRVTRPKALRVVDRQRPLGARRAQIETASLDLKVGLEVIAVILEATDFANDLKELSSFQVGANSGISPTDASPVLCRMLPNSGG